MFTETTSQHQLHCLIQLPPTHFGEYRLSPGSSPHISESAECPLSAATPGISKSAECPLASATPDISTSVGCPLAAVVPDIS
jgi:hypothetical protein